MKLDPHQILLPQEGMHYLRNGTKDKAGNFDVPSPSIPATSILISIEEYWPSARPAVESSMLIDLPRFIAVYDDSLKWRGLVKNWSQ